MNWLLSLSLICYWMYVPTCTICCTKGHLNVPNICSKTVGGIYQPCTSYLGNCPANQDLRLFRLTKLFNHVLFCVKTKLYDKMHYKSLLQYVIHQLYIFCYLLHVLLNGCVNNIHYLSLCTIVIFQTMFEICSIWVGGFSFNLIRVVELRRPLQCYTVLN